MRVWLLTVGEPLPTDRQGERLHRTGMLAESLAGRGHDVLWWSSTFDHSHKRFRSAGEVEIKAADHLRIRLLDGPAYQRNVSLARLANHRALGKRFRRLAPGEAKPDVIVASWPTIELCEMATAYGRASGVPVVLDVRDLWPDIFVELAPRWARPAARLAVAPMTIAARKSFRRASAITGVTPAFVAWGLGQADRPAFTYDRSFPLGYSDKRPSPSSISQAETSWEQLGVSRRGGDFVVAFVGTMGLQKLNMEPVMTAARALAGQGFRFVFCGDGDGLSQFQSLADGLENVVFPGWVGHAQIWSLLRIASAGLAPYRPSLNYTNNLPNKPIEYLSAGLPILSSLDGTLRSLLEMHGCGVTYKGADDLVSSLKSLREAPGRVAAMSAAATSLYRKEFIADNVYGAMADHLEVLAKAEPRPAINIPRKRAVASW